MTLYVQEGTPPLVPSAMARIERRLPHPGEVLVREGSRVEADDPVARAFLPAPRQIINVAQILAIPPAQVEQVMLAEVGQQVVVGGELARTGLMGGRVCRTPTGGIIVDIDTETGYVTLAPDPIEFTLSANIRGVVMEIIPHEGVVIETPAAQLYGVFGFGRERGGVLQLFVTDPDQVITHEHIDARSAYTILIGGAGITAAAMQRAVEAQVRGVIVGGIDEAEWRAFLGWSSQRDWQSGMADWHVPNTHHTPDPGLTLLVTEGFGMRPMSQPIFEMLSARAGQEALIDGITCLRRRMRRPRIVISLARSEAQVELAHTQLRPEAHVRLLDSAHLGQIAKILAVPSLPLTLESGVRAAAVQVSQDQQPPFWVPRTAVEVLD